MIRYRRILHSTDFSTASRPAFAHAVALARSTRGSLTLLHVVTPLAPAVGDAYISPASWINLQRQVRHQAERELGRLLARARKAGVRATALVLEGTPADRIVRAARAKRANLIVMGTHGRGGLAKLFLGSVASRVVGTAPCPVLTVRGR